MRQPQHPAPGLPHRASGVCMGVPSRAAGWLCWGATGFASQPASTLGAAFPRAAPLLEAVPASGASSGFRKTQQNACTPFPAASPGQIAAEH